MTGWLIRNGTVDGCAGRAGRRPGPRRAHRRDGPSAATVVGRAGDRRLGLLGDALVEAVRMIPGHKHLVFEGSSHRLRVLQSALDKPVFKAPRQFTRLRELSRIHMTLVGDVVRAQSRIKSLYRPRGAMVTGVHVYGPRRREKGIRPLK